MGRCLPLRITSNTAHSHAHTKMGELQTNLRNNPNTPLEDRQLTYAAATTHALPITSLCKPMTFHTVTKDNTYTYPFEDIPHLLITGRYSGATLPKNQIVFKDIFERGQAATHREVLHACCTYAMQSIRNRLGIALQIDNIDDPINVVTKRTKNRLVSHRRHLSGFVFRVDARSS